MTSYGMVTMSKCKRKASDPCWPSRNAELKYMPDQGGLSDFEIWFMVLLKHPKIIVGESNVEAMLDFMSLHNLREMYKYTACHGDDDYRNYMCLCEIETVVKRHSNVFKIRRESINEDLAAVKRIDVWRNSSVAEAADYLENPPSLRGHGDGERSYPRIGGGGFPWFEKISKKTLLSHARRLEII